ncbi:MAG: DUF47 family protein [Candidatus Heimdallarchaeota archaeon]|nr:DUF47 family protein [Candidatus Heimdallarchaeota archaeon]MDH5644507.1 DUF47 family protein [Candidatus Heimdallarchaeota archaeon]
MSVISSYLSSRKQRNIAALLSQHAGRCKAVGYTLQKIIKSWLDGKEEELAINKEIIHSEEKSADNLEKQLVVEVAKSELPDNKFQEDLLNFVRMLDSSAGGAKRAATNILLLMKYPLPDRYGEIVIKAGEVIVEMFTLIEKAVKNIHKSPDVIELGMQVDKLEDKMDSYYKQLKESYFEIEKSFNSSAALIILDHVCRDLEYSADTGEDAMDILVELVQRK